MNAKHYRGTETTMTTFEAIYNGRTTRLEASSVRSAQTEAMKRLGAKFPYQVSVISVLDVEDVPDVHCTVAVTTAE